MSRIDGREDDLEDRVVRSLKARRLIAARRWPAFATFILALALIGGATILTRPFQSEGELYMFALYSGAPQAGGGERRAAEYGRWARRHDRGGAVVVGGEELGEIAATLGPERSAGPELAGYFIVRARSREDAIELAGTTPHLRYGGSVEVRRIER